MGKINRAVSLLLLAAGILASAGVFLWGKGMRFWFLSVKEGRKQIRQRAYQKIPWGICQRMRQRESRRAAVVDYVNTAEDAAGAWGKSFIRFGQITGGFLSDY